MTALIRSAARSYGSWGVVLLVMGAGMLALHHRDYVTGYLADWFAWQIVTGAALAGLMIYQWGLLAARLSGNAEASRARYRWHRYVGVAMTGLFILHAVRLGYHWTSALTVVFLLNGAVGLMNRELVRYRTRGRYLLWYGGHVALSAILVPLVVLHIWVALAFE